MRGIIINCIVGLLLTAVSLYILITGTIHIPPKTLSRQTAPEWYWAYLAIYAVAAMLCLYRAATGYKKYRSGSARDNAPKGL